MPSKRKSSGHIQAKKPLSTKAPLSAKRRVKSAHRSGTQRNRSGKGTATTSARRATTSGTLRRAVRENEEKYRVLFEQAEDGIVLIDIETGHIVDCNQEFESLSGRNLKQLKRFKIWELRPGGEVEIAKSEFLEIKKSGTVDRKELQFKKPRGDVVSVESVSRIVKAQDKQYIQATVRDITEGKRADTALRKLAGQLGERVKELNCLYGIADLIATPGISLDEILQGTARLIPPAWRYPEITCARVVFEDRVFRTENFKETSWKQSSAVRAHGRRVGSLDVFYLEKRPEEDEGPFLREERNLIDAIAERLGRVIERRKAREALQQSEKKYREFVDSLPQIVFEVDVRGKLTFVNQRALENYGYTQEDFQKGLKIFQLVIPEDREKLKTAIRMGLSGKSSARYEYTAVRKNGSRFPVAAHAAPIVHGNQITGLRGIVIDITERKEAERALEESERKHRTLVEQSLQGILVIQDFRVCFANEATAQISGYTIEELLSLSPEQLRSAIHLGDQALVWGRFRDRLAGKPIPPHQEYRIKRKDGTAAWIETFSNRIQYAGKPAIQATLIDITDRKNAERALEEVNKRLETLLDHTHMMVAYLDSQFNFIRVNRAYAEADKRDPSFFPGKNHFDLYPHKENQEIFRRVVETGKPYFTSAKPFEYAEHPERGVTYWDWSLVPIKDPRGAVTGLVLTVLNVTERKRAEGRLEWELTVNRAVAELSSALITPSPSIEDIANIVLDAAKGLTQSEHGFVSSIDPETGDNVGHTLTKMMGKQCLVQSGDRKIRFPIGPDGRYAALWGHALNSRSAFFTNSPDTHEASRGIPEGHIPIRNYLAVPAIIGEELVGQIALANSPKDYTDRDLEAVKRLAVLYAMAIQRRQAEENIKQQKEFLNNVIESLTYPFYVIDANDYTIKMANLAAGPANLSETTTCHALTHRSKRPCEGTEHPCPLEEVKRTKKLVIVEHIHYDKEGNARNVDVHANPIFDNERNVVQVIEYCLDTTERRRAEEALRESEEKFRTLAEQSPNMIFINRSGRVVYANKKCEDIMGYKRAEFYSPDFDFFTLIAPESKGKIRTNFSRHMKGQEVSPCEYTLISKSRRRVEAILATKLMRYQGENAILGTVTDITERKRIEEEIQKLNKSLELRARELAAANKELQAFSYSVSHDLRAPLRAIDGFSRALLEDYGNKLDQPGKDYLRRVRAATEHMGQLIDDLLKLSVMIRREIKREEIDFSEVARSVATDLQKIEPDRQVEFLIQEGVLGHGDPSLLRAVLENLVGNAWKFTSKHSRAKIEFGTIENKGQTVYFVRDDGAGFDMTYANKLFLPFQRLHSSAEFSGNGIGLTLADRIITRHGGRIWAEGEVEKGATFYFTLP